MKSRLARSRAVRALKARIKRNQKKDKGHDATHWRTQPTSAADADSRPVFHRSARLPRDVHSPRGPHGPLVQRLHGRDTNSAPADFSDGEPHHHAAFSLWIGRN